MIITVQDLIDFLSNLPPDKKVILDKDGWDYYGDAKEDAISALIDDWDDYVIINN